MKTSSRFILGVIFCALLFIAMAVVIKLPSTPQATRQDRAVTIENQTRSLEVISSKIKNDVNGMLILVLKNNGDKPIRTYSIKINENTYSGKEFDVAPKLLLPGETDTFQELLSNIARNKAADEPLKVSIELAYFADDSAEGDWELAEQKRQQYEGAAIAYKAARSQAEALLDVPYLNPLALAVASERVGSLTPPDGLTENQKSGFQTGLHSLQAIIYGMRQNEEQASDIVQVTEFNKNELKRYLQKSDAELTRRLKRDGVLMRPTRRGQNQ